MGNKVTITKGGIGLDLVLFFIFLVLKLTNLIDWSWWWVTSPLWLGYAIIIACVIIGLLIALLGGLIETILKN